MEEEWGPWIEHDGRGCPVTKGTIVNTLYHTGDERIGPALSDQRGGRQCGWDWSERHPTLNPARIVAYRVRKPRGLTILEEIAKGIREPVDA